MKVKQKSSKGKAGNVLRGPKIVKKMKAPSKKLLGIKKDQMEEIVAKKKIGKVKSSKKAEKNGKSLSKLEVSQQTIAGAVKLLMDLEEERSSTKKTLLENNEQVFLTMTWVTKPVVPDSRRVHFKLKHGLYGSDPEVCLIVCDYTPFDKIKRTPDERIELSVDHYNDILKTHGVKGISTIMPLFQLRTEYSTYELRRKLVNQFDLFIVQSDVMQKNSYFKSIGIAFTKKNKVPIAVTFPKDKKTPDPGFAERMSQAIRSSWYVLKPHSDTVSMRIGNLSNTAEQLAENIESVLVQLTEERKDGIPGGYKNIRNIMLKTAKSKAIPLYVNLAKADSSHVVVLDSVKPSFPIVKGSMTTLPGKKVTVLPDGDLIIKDNPNEEVDRDMWSDDEDNDDDKFARGKKRNDRNSKSAMKRPQSSEDVPKGGKKQKTKELKKKKIAVSDDESDSGDELADAAEQQYLKAWSKEIEEDEAEKKDNRKQENLKKKDAKVKKTGKAKGTKLGKGKFAGELPNKKSPVSPKKAKKTGSPKKGKNITEKKKRKQKN